MLGSSEGMQRSRLDSFFAALEPRRAAFPVIIVHQLHDLDEAGCDALVSAHGLPPNDVFGNYMCHAGLRAADGTPKEAWPRFMQASAHYAHP
jgi:hypothetical protein